MPVFKSLRPELVYYIYNAITALICSRYVIESIYYVDMVKMDPLQLVLVGTVLESFYFLSEIPTGIVADAFSRRLSIIIGVFIVGAACLLEGLVPTFPVVCAATAILAIGFAFLSGATEAWLADEVGEDKVGPVLIRSSQVIRIVSIAGTFGVIALASVRLNIPLLAAGGLNLLLGIFLILFMTENGFKPVPREKRNNWHLMLTTFRRGATVVKGSRILIIILLITVIWGVSSEGYDRLWQAHLWSNFTFPDLFNLKPVVWFGIISILTTLTSLTVTGLNRHRFESISRNPARIARWLTVFSILTVLAGTGLALTGNIIVAMFIVLAYGTIHSIADPLFSTLCIRNTRPEVRATVISIIGQSNSIGQVAGGPISGAVGKYASLRAALGLSALLYLPVPFLYGWVSRKKREVE